MKKIYTGVKLQCGLILIVSVAALCSCAKDIKLEEAIFNTDYCISATIDKYVKDTKSGISDVGEFYWLEGESVSLLLNNASFTSLPLISCANTPKAVFSGKLPIETNAENLAIYPARSAILGPDNKILINLPSTYDLHDNKYESLTPMIGEIGENNHAVFSHLCSQLRLSFFSLPETAASISISASKRICGDFPITENGNRKVIITDEEESGREISIRLPEFANSRDAVINVPIPVGEIDKLVISVLDKNMNILWTKESSKSKTITAGNVYKFSFIISYEYIDLGLPSGTLWATMNVGADCPEGYGDYFAWGETSPKDEYLKSNYSFNVTTSDHIVLPTESDAASVNWGTDWRMPTCDEFGELLMESKLTSGSKNGVKGQFFEGPNGNNLFLPFSGAYYEYPAGKCSPWLIGSAPAYWCGEKLANKYGACNYSYSIFSSDIVYEKGDYKIGNSNYYDGHTVRPVFKGTPRITLTSAATIPVGEQIKLNFFNPTGKDAIWSSADESVVTVSQDGRVMGIAKGRTTITVKAGEEEKSCNVLVIEAPEISVSARSSALSIINNIMQGSISWAVANNSPEIVKITNVELFENTNPTAKVSTAFNQTMFPGDAYSFTVSIYSSYKISTPKLVVTALCNDCEFKYYALYER